MFPPKSPTLGMNSNLAPHCERLLACKAKSGKTFEKLSQETGKPEVWLAALFFGNAVTDPDTASRIAANVGCTDKETIACMAGRAGASAGSAGCITRGRGWEWPPRDPVLYRFAEAVMVYGDAWKAIIYEKFGDGIMSAISFRSEVERVKDPKGDRVVITLDGKFLPYSGTDEW